MKDKDWPVRLFTLDVSRGIAALSVVFWHWEHFAYHGTVKPADFSPGAQPLYEFFKPFYERGHSGVQYFFMLSGFVFFWLYRDAIRSKSVSAYEFTIQRISRLCPLHLVTLGLVALLQIVYFSREQVPFVYGNNDPFHFFLHLGFASSWGIEEGISYNGPVWSVSVEVLLYAIFFVVALIGQGGILFCLLLTAVASGLFMTTDHGVFNGAAMFFLGGVVYHATRWITKKAFRLAIPVWSLTVILWAGVLVHYYVVDLFRMITFPGVPDRLFVIGFQFYLLFPLTICSLALLGIARSGFSKSVSWIGDITYSSYLLHFPMQLVLGLAISYGWLARGFYEAPVSILLFFAVLIPLSYLVYCKFERPMQKAIRKRWLRAPQPSMIPEPETLTEISFRNQTEL